MYQQQLKTIPSISKLSAWQINSASLSLLQKIPKWWIWLYYVCPTSWALNGMMTSQYGDIDKEIEAFGETKIVAAFLKDYFGFHHDQLYVVAIVLAAFPIVIATLFTYCIGHLNYQRRWHHNSLLVSECKLSCTIFISIQISELWQWSVCIQMVSILDLKVY